MHHVLEADPGKFGEKVAEQLGLKQPEWADFVKTGSGRQRPPEQQNWWNLRAASILRRLYVNYPQPVGVQRLRSYYGNAKNNGHQPKHFRRSSGKILRTILQDLEKMNYVKNVEKPKKGRVITPEGKRLLDTVAKAMK